MRIVRSPLVSRITGKMGNVYFRKRKGGGYHIVKRHDDPAPHKTTPWLLNKAIVTRLDAHWRTMSKAARLEWAICPPKKHMSALGHFYYVNLRRMFIGFTGIDVPIDTNRPHGLYWVEGGSWEDLPVPNLRVTNMVYEWDANLWTYWDMQSHPSRIHTCQWHWLDDLKMWNAWVYHPRFFPTEPEEGVPYAHLWMYDWSHPRYKDPPSTAPLCDPVPEPCIDQPPPPVIVTNIQNCGVDKAGNVITPDTGPIEPPCPFKRSECEGPPPCRSWPYGDYYPGVASDLSVQFPFEWGNPCKPGLCWGTIYRVACTGVGPMFSCCWRGTMYDQGFLFMYNIDVCCHMETSNLWAWWRYHGVLDYYASLITTLEPTPQGRLEGTAALTGKATPVCPASAGDTRTWTFTPAY